MAITANDYKNCFLQHLFTLVKWLQIAFKPIIPNNQYMY
jgi:hypothetical protein